MKRYEARKEADGTWRMYVDGLPSKDRWAGQHAEESARVYEQFWNTEYGAIVRQYGYYNAVRDGLIVPDSYGALTIVREQLKQLYAEQEAKPTQKPLWQGL